MTTTDPNFDVQRAQVDDINRLCDMKAKGDLTAEQFFGAVEVTLGRRPRNEELGALLRGIAEGRLPTAVLTTYLEAVSGEDVPARPTGSCGCGYDLIWCAGAWQHDAAPYLWGDDHDPDAPEPTGPQRDYWDAEDGVTDERTPS